MLYKISLFFMVMIVWLSFTTSGCSRLTAIHGNLLEEQRLARINVGASTRSEVQAILGSPTMVSTFDPNIWYYTGQKTKRIAFLPPQTVEATIVSIHFDDNDQVQAIEHRDENSIIDIAFIDRQTPTRGREMSFLEQLFSNLILRTPQQ